MRARARALRALVAAPILGVAAVQALPPWQGLSADPLDAILAHAPAAKPPDPGNRDRPALADSDGVGLVWRTPLHLRRSDAPNDVLGGQTRTAWLRKTLSPALSLGVTWIEAERTLGYGADSTGIGLRWPTGGWAPSLQFSPRASHRVTAWLQFPGMGGTSGGYGAAWQGRLRRVTAEIDLAQGHMQSTVTAVVPGYAPLEAPGKLQTRRGKASLAYEGRHHLAQWQGSLEHWQSPRQSESTLAHGLYAWFGRQGGALTWRRALRLEGEGTLGYGHVTAYRGKEGPRAGFAYLPFDLSLLRGAAAWESPSPWATWGIAAQGTRFSGRLLTPLDPVGHWLWNRNQILDAYQGSITGLFSRQTWLGTGRATLTDLGGTLWVEKPWCLAHSAPLGLDPSSLPGEGGFAAQLQPRILLGLHHLATRAAADLLRRDTELLIATRETQVPVRVAPESRWLLHPGFAMSLGLGRLTVQGEMSQVVPVSELLSHSSIAATGERAGDTWQGGLAWRFGCLWSWR